MILSIGTCRTSFFFFFLFFLFLLFYLLNVSFPFLYISSFVCRVGAHAHESTLRVWCMCSMCVYVWCVCVRVSLFSITLAVLMSQCSSSTTLHRTTCINSNHIVSLGTKNNTFDPFERLLYAIVNPISNR